MKLLVAMLFLSISFSSLAANYGAAGCGLGSLVFEKDQTWWKQVLASTTNTIGMQTIAITIGTSNCDAPTPLKVGQAQAFVEANRVALANDIARGNGETIVGLSRVYGCEDSENFGRNLKSNYSNIFPTAHSNPEEITKTITAVAKESCKITI